MSDFVLINDFLQFEFLPCCLLVLFLALVMVAIRWRCSFAVGLRKRCRGRTYCPHEASGPPKQATGEVGALGLLSAFLQEKASFRSPGEVRRAYIEPGRLFLSAVWSGSFCYKMNSCKREETCITSFLALHSDLWVVVLSVRHCTKKLGWVNPTDIIG